jgi:hypothetical protein
MSDVVLFDPNQTLGSEIATPDQLWKGFEAYPSIDEQLRMLRANDRARLGAFVFSEFEGDHGGAARRRVLAALRNQELLGLIDQELVEVIPRDEVRPFASLLAKLQLDKERVVVVSLDAGVRAGAYAEGVRRIAPHPALAAAVLDREPLSYVRLAAKKNRPLAWDRIVGEPEVVPLLGTGRSENHLYAVASERAIVRLSVPPDALDVERLAGSKAAERTEAVARTSLVMLQVTREQIKGDANLKDFVSGLEKKIGRGKKNYPLVRQTPQGILVALRGDHSADALHPPPAGAGHGHIRALPPDPSFLKPPAWRGELAPRDLTDAERGVFEALDPAAFRNELESMFGSGRREERPR